jgi:hypothetical protein
MPILRIYAILEDALIRRYGIMQARHYFIVIVLALVSVIGLAATSGPSLAEPPELGQGFVFISPTPIPTSTPLPTATPLITPSPTPAAPGCFLGSFDIPIGSTVTLRSGINIRAEPRVSSAWLGNFPEPRNFIVIQGPVCGNDYQWWRIQGHGITGWVAEQSTIMPFIISVDPPPGALDACINRLNLRAGQVIDLTGNVRIRQEPGLDGLVLTVASPDTPVTILQDETRCVDGYNWRHVEVTVVNFTYRGWMAEGSAMTANLFYIEPTPDPFAECNTPMNLRAGDQRRVRYVDGNPKSLRATPGEDGELLYTLVTGVPFEVIGGPVCAGGMNYWQIRIMSNIDATGWFPEGPRPNYWSEPFYSSNAYRPLR